jgi:hypothetical protein
MPEPVPGVAAFAAAQQAVTAAIHGDYSTVRDIVHEYPTHEALAFALLGLVVRTHNHWANLYGLGDDDRKAAWAEIAGEVEIWRSGKEQAVEGEGL